MDLKVYREYTKVTRRFKEAELVLKNAKIINVFTNEIITGDIAIEDGMIVGIGNYEGKQEHDMTGKYVCPGFIDSHLHLESTLVTPKELVTVASRHGTTTFIVDPHESANVSGLAGINYILDQTEDASANVFVMMPSCVPATSIDDNGCTLTAEDMTQYLDNERILGLGEVMDYISVVNADPGMHRKLDLFKNKVRDGHAPFLAEEDLQAYVMAGISTDHECSDFQYAMRERRNGMTVLIREGSAAKNLEAIVKGIVENNIPVEGFCFCTDDKHIEDIEREGHIDHNVRKAIELGMNPVSAIKMATIYPAICYGFHNLGAVAPGYQADLVVLNDLNKISIENVYYKGEVIEQEEEIEIKKCPDELKNTVHVGKFSKNDLQLESPTGYFPVIEMQEGQITTKKQIKKFSGGKCLFLSNAQYQKIAVIERHKSTGKTGVGIVSGFGIQKGAIASSVSHDSHNIIVVGVSDEEMEFAVNSLIEQEGGIVLVKDGKVIEQMPMPIAGLMSDQSGEWVDEKLTSIHEKAYTELGICGEVEPVMTLCFMSLAVIPEIKLTDMGLFDVTTFSFIPVEVK